MRGLVCRVTSMILSSRALFAAALVTKPALKEWPE